MNYPTYLPALYVEIDDARKAAHRKHGDNSIEAIEWDSSRWLPILTEEVGEAAHELTYDQATGSEQADRLRAELVQVAAVTLAWVAAIDRGAK